jgi:type II secretory pathway component PulM
MESSPLSRHFDLRLKELNQQIHSCLKDVRKHLQELEQAAQQAPSAKPPADFAQLLKESLQQRTPPPGPDK